MASYKARGIAGMRFEHVATFEVRRAARDALRATSDATLFGDITPLLPDGLVERADLLHTPIDKLVEQVLV